MEKEEIIFLPQIEEEIITFINKIQLIYEDIKNKEKFINDFEQKFELINESCRSRLMLIGTKNENSF